MTLTKTLLVGAALALMAGDAVAQEFPNRAITVIVPYAPGSTDTLARVLSEGMSEQLGQPVVVETRPGAAGGIGAAAVAAAPPDGHTVLMAISGAITLVPQLNELPYDFDALEPVARVAISPNLIAARSDAPFTTIPELVEYAEAHPGEVSYGSAGMMSMTHIAGEAISAAAGVELFHIPFDGVTPAIAATIAGDVDLVLGNASALLPQTEAGALIALAQLGAERTLMVPDVPTLKEGGLDLALVPNIYGYWAPTGTPEAVVNALAAAIEHAAATDVVQDFGRKSLAEISYTGPAELRQITEEENNFYKELLPTIDIAQ